MRAESEGARYAHHARRGAGTVPGIAARFAAVVLVAALLLLALDALPRVAGGEARGFKRFDSIETLEREASTKLYLPAYFPLSIGWPPASVRLFSLPPRAAILTFHDTASGEETLVLCQTLDGRGDLSRFVPGRTKVLHEATIDLAGRQARLSRFVLTGDSPVHELAWESEDRSFLLRYTGPPATLMKMAESLERGAGK